jgi:hypothetical protein
MSNIEDEANFTKAAVDFLTAPETTAARPPPRPRAPAKKVAAKRAPARKAVAKKAPAKKASAKKASVKKIARKKPARKQASAKKAPAKTAGAKKTNRKDDPEEAAWHEDGREKKDVSQEKKLNNQWSIPRVSPWRPLPSRRAPNFLARLFRFVRLREFQDEPVALANRRIFVPVLILQPVGGRQGPHTVGIILGVLGIGVNLGRAD